MSNLMCLLAVIGAAILSPLLLAAFVVVYEARQVEKRDGDTL